MEPPTVVIDNGTGYTKMGYAGNLAPGHIIPSAVAMRVNSREKNNFKVNDLDFVIGDDAHRVRTDPANWDFHRLLRAGQVETWEGIEKFWHKAMYDYIGCEPSEHKFILTEPPMNSPENREQMAEIMFETFGVKGLFIGVQAVLALYSQVCGPNAAEGGLQMTQDDLTGVVVDSGDGVTHVFPVASGYVVASCVKHIPLAGSNITEFTMNMLKDRGENINPEDIKAEAQKIKEKYAYVCDDLVEEFKKYDTPIQGPDGWALNNKFKKYTYKPSKGAASRKIDIGYERFLAPEMFFHPEFFNKDWVTPLDEVIDETVQGCPIDFRRKLYNNIVLSGGSTLFDGFDTRLKRLVQKRVDYRLGQFEAISGRKPTPIPCEIKQNMVQAYAVWFGGSYLGSQDSFQYVCKTKQQYEEEGPSICRHNSIFAAQM